MVLIIISLHVGDLQCGLKDSGVRSHGQLKS
jgi:hypothetical protein